MTDNAQISFAGGHKMPRHWMAGQYCGEIIFTPILKPALTAFNHGDFPAQIWRTKTLFSFGPITVNFLTLENTILNMSTKAGWVSRMIRANQTFQPNPENIKQFKRITNSTGNYRRQNLTMYSFM